MFIINNYSFVYLYILSFNYCFPYTYRYFFYSCSVIIIIICIKLRNSETAEIHGYSLQKGYILVLGIGRDFNIDNWLLNIDQYID